MQPTAINRVRLRAPKLTRRGETAWGKLGSTGFGFNAGDDSTPVIPAQDVQCCLLLSSIAETFAPTTGMPSPSGRSVSDDGNGVVLPKNMAVLEKVPKGRPHISITKGGSLKKLIGGEIAIGRRPKPKSDDFFERTPSVIEVIAILCLKRLNNCSTVWEHYPAAQRRGNVKWREAWCRGRGAAGTPF